MRLLADENIPKFAVDELRRRGHDVFWARTELPGASDPQLLQRARDEERTLVSFDKDFGRLIFRDHLPTPRGVFLLRFPPGSPIKAAQRITATVESQEDWSGVFAVVREDAITIRALPKS